MRHSKFMFLAAVALVEMDQKSGHLKAVKALDYIDDPNVASMIEQGIDETVRKKVTDYAQWVFGLGPKPLWFVLSTEGPVDPTDPNGAHFKTPEHFDDLK